MKVISYVEAEHRAQVDEWIAAWPSHPIRPGWLSSTGFIVPGIAAGWLYTTDSAIGILDSLISNPNAPEEQREEAIEALGDAAEASARAKGLRYLLATSGNRQVLERCHRRGYKFAHNQCQVLLELKP